MYGIIQDTMLGKNKHLLLLASFAFGFLVFLFLAPTASATTGINSELSFEGKIVNSSGVNITNGTYNTEFTIYTGCSNEPTSNTGCSLTWTEDYLTSASEGVTFNGGTFQVDLGQYCAFSGGTCQGNTNTAIDWNSYPIYFSIQIGGAANCTPGGNFTTNCSGDGVMGPYMLLTATPYSLNSNALGGLTASQFGQLATGSQTWTGTNSFADATNSTGAFVVQNAGGANTVLAVDTTNLRVGIGTPTPAYTLDVSGSLRSDSYVLGTGPDLSIQPISGSQSVVTTWWGLQLVGNKQSSVVYTPTNYGTSGQYGVIIPVQQAASVGVMIQAAASQSGNLFQIQNSSTTILDQFDSAGTLTVASGDSYTGFGAVTLSSGAGTALTITGNAASTFSTTAGDLTIQGGSGTVSLGTSTVLSASGALSVESTGANALTLTGGAASTWSTSAGAITITSGSGNIILDAANGGTANVQIGVGNGGAGSTTPDILVLDDGSLATDPTEVDGGMYYNVSTDSFRCGVAGTWENCIGGLMSSSAPVTAVSTCTTTCAPIATSTNVFKANFCVAGKVIHIIAGGVHSTTSTPTLAFSVYLGTSTTKTSDTLLGAAATQASAGSSQTNLGWHMDVYIYCISPTSVWVEGGSAILTTTAGGNSQSEISATAATTISNTTQNLYIFPAWSASSSSNTVVAHEFIVSGL